MADEAWLESVAMRPMLEALLEAVCSQKPDVLLAFAIAWMRESYPEQASAAFSAMTPCEWSPRQDVDSSPDGLMAYLKDVDATDTLEGILERAIRSQPVNVVAFVIDECAALMSGVATVDPPDGGVSGFIGRMADAAVQGSTAHPDAPAFFEAVANGEVEVVAALLTDGVPADARDQKTHATALLTAAEGQEECLLELLRAGATVDAQNKHGETALMLAVKYADAECMRLLLDARADPTLRDVSGKSAVEYAAEMDEPELLALLDPTGSLGAGLLKPPPQRKPKSSRRGSVSSESIDPHEQVDLSAIPQYAKSPKVMARLAEYLEGGFLFRSLDPATRTALLLSMVEKAYAAGEAVITQGEAGDFFYIVDSGALDCYVAADDAPPPGRKVTSYAAGATFGELALMYGCPRKATIVATTDVLLFGIEREVFRTLVLVKYMAQRLRFEEIVAGIPLLSSMDQYERAALADACEEAPYPAGSHIICEGEFGQTFYILLEGSAVATQADEAGVECPVKSYASGECVCTRSRALASHAPLSTAAQPAGRTNASATGTSASSPCCAMRCAPRASSRRRTAVASCLTRPLSSASSGPCVPSSRATPITTPSTSERRHVA